MIRPEENLEKASQSKDIDIKEKESHDSSVYSITENLQKLLNLSSQIKTDIDSIHSSENMASTTISDTFVMNTQMESTDNNSFPQLIANREATKTVKFCKDVVLIGENNSLDVSISLQGSPSIRDENVFTNENMFTVPGSPVDSVPHVSLQNGEKDIIMECELDDNQMQAVEECFSRSDLSNEDEGARISDIISEQAEQLGNKDICSNIQIVVQEGECSQVQIKNLKSELHEQVSETHGPAQRKDEKQDNISMPTDANKILQAQMEDENLDNFDMSTDENKSLQAHVKDGKQANVSIPSYADKDKLLQPHTEDNKLDNFRMPSNENISLQAHTEDENISMAKDEIEILQAHVEDGNMDNMATEGKQILQTDQEECEVGETKANTCINESEEYSTDDDKDLTDNINIYNKSPILLMKTDSCLQENKEVDQKEGLLTESKSNHNTSLTKHLNANSQDLKEHSSPIVLQEKNKQAPTVDIERFSQIEGSAWEGTSTPNKEKGAVGQQFCTESCLDASQALSSNEKTELKLSSTLPLIFGSVNKASNILNTEHDIAKDDSSLAASSISSLVKIPACSAPYPKENCRRSLTESNVKSSFPEKDINSCSDENIRIISCDAIIQDEFPKVLEQGTHGMCKVTSLELVKDCLSNSESGKKVSVAMSKEKAKLPKLLCSQASQVPLVWSRPTEIGAPQDYSIVSPQKTNLPNMASSAAQVSHKAEIHSTYACKKPFQEESKSGIKHHTEINAKKLEKNGISNQETEKKIFDPSFVKEKDVRPEDEQRNGIGLKDHKKNSTDQNNKQSNGKGLKNIFAFKDEQNTESGLECQAETQCFQIDEKLNGIGLEGHTGADGMAERTRLSNSASTQPPGLLQRLSMLFSGIRRASGHEAKREAVNQKLEDFGYWDEVSDDGSQISGYSQGSGIYLRRIREMEAGGGGRRGQEEPHSQLEELILLCQSGDLLTRNGR